MSGHRVEVNVETDQPVTERRVAIDARDRERAGDAVLVGDRECGADLEVEVVGRVGVHEYFVELEAGDRAVLEVGVDQLVERVGVDCTEALLVAFDDGSLLRSLGDPRDADAQLPLWVVIDRTGTVREFHSGFYEVRPDTGLTELNSMIGKMAAETP